MPSQHLQLEINSCIKTTGGGSLVNVEKLTVLGGGMPVHWEDCNVINILCQQEHVRLSENNRSYLRREEEKKSGITYEDSCLYNTDTSIT